MSTEKRVKHGEEEAAIAYRLQVLGAREGALKGTMVGVPLVAFLHYRYPMVARQTLAGKAFLASWFSIFGMITYSDHYLIGYERNQRKEQELWRSEARRELAASGTVPSETAMQAYKQKYYARLQAEKSESAGTLTQAGESTA